MKSYRSQRALGLAAIGLIVSVLACSASGGAGRPETIVSKRLRILSSERYGTLYRAWQTYTKEHPDDASGWTQLAKAARYAGVPCDEYIPYAEKAYALDPESAEACATLGDYRWSTYCKGQPADPSQAIRLLEHAVELDPDLDEPRYTLWAMDLSQGRSDAAATQLMQLIDRRAMPDALVDLGYNLLIGLEPNAILLTNGDNDTYPPLALQAARQVRTDVAVVNLSLLNLRWYRDLLRKGPHAVPVPVIDEAAKGPQSLAALAGLIDNLESAGWKRALYAANTVDLGYYRIGRDLSLEGVVYRVLPAKGDAIEIDGDRIGRNLDRRYRLESATSLAIDWDAWSSLRPLMLNYAAARFHHAEALARGGDPAGAAAEMDRALELCDFHGNDKLGRELVSAWSEWNAKSPEFAKWKKRFAQ